MFLAYHKVCYDDKLIWLTFRINVVFRGHVSQKFSGVQGYHTSTWTSVYGECWLARQGCGIGKGSIRFWKKKSKLEGSKLNLKRTMGLLPLKQSVHFPLSWSVRTLPVPRMTALPGIRQRQGPNSLLSRKRTEQRQNKVTIETKKE